MVVVQVSRILVVDDETGVRSTLSVILNHHGHSVVAVDSGSRALRELRESPFDLAIVDVFMLQMDGMTLINKLREHTPGLPIVVITGGAHGEVAVDFLNTAPEPLGLVCLLKPIRPRDLLEAIAKALEPATG
jgi:CheY-like chemotaxis protein